MLTTTVTYRMITRDLERSLATTANRPQVARATEYYLANIGKVKSIGEFLADRRLYSYAMKAFGLEEMAYAKAFTRKALVEGVDESDSFANRLTDQRYKELVETFNFARNGESTTTSAAARQGTVDRYIRQTLEEDAGKQSEGARLALYFARKASSIQSAYNILADAALLKVVQTALGLPKEMSYADIDKQAKLINARLDVDDLSDPKKLKSLLDKFTSRYDLANPPASSAQPSLLIGQSTMSTISTDLLMALQNLKLGGR